MDYLRKPEFIKNPQNTRRICNLGKNQNFWAVLTIIILIIINIMRIIILIIITFITESRSKCQHHKNQKTCIEYHLKAKTAHSSKYEGLDMN